MNNQRSLGELLKQVIIANPPRMIGAVFKIISFIMPEKVLSRFGVANTIPTDMERYLLFNAIPSEYLGGKKIAPPYMENGCLFPKQLDKDNYLVNF